MAKDSLTKRILNSKIIKTGLAFTGLAVGGLAYSASSIDSKVLKPSEAHAWDMVSTSASSVHDDPLIEEYEPTIEVSEPTVHTPSRAYHSAGSSESKPPTFDDYISNFIYGNDQQRAAFLGVADNWLKANGDNYVVALSGLLFKEGETRAYANFGFMNNSISENPDDNRLPTLKQAWNSGAVDILTVLRLLQKQNDAIYVIDHQTYNLIEKIKKEGVPEGQLALNGYNASSMFLDWVPIRNGEVNENGIVVPANSALQYIRAMYGDLGGKEEKDLIKEIAHAPPVSLLNPRKFYLRPGESCNFALQLGRIKDDGTFAIKLFRAREDEDKNLLNNVVYYKINRDKESTLLQIVPVGYVVPTAAK